MTKNLLFSPLLIALCLLSCKKGDKHIPSKKIRITNTELITAMQSINWGVYAKDSSAIKAQASCFSKENYNPFITEEGGLNEIKKLHGLLAALPKHGLGKYLQEDALALAQGITLHDSTIYAKKHIQDYAAIATLENTARKAYIEYARLMNYGTLNADSIFIEKFHLPVLQADSVFYCNAFRAATVEEIKPKNRHYNNLQAAYANYSIDDTSKFELLPTLPKGKTTVGKQYVGLPLLRNRLGLTALPDSLSNRKKNTYDSLTFESVKKFQEDNDLNADGIIGSSTWKMLNLSPADKKQKMEITLERFRWQYNVDTTNYIQANIPEYKLRVFENGKQVKEHIICVGKPRPRSYNSYTKKNRPYHVRNYETPEFSDTLETVVVNPTWAVTKSISRLEILPNLQANPQYAVANNYKIYAGREEINAAEYDWNKVNMSDFNYRVVQQPGSFNALGKIKFLFPNPYAIYFHDTPSKSYFKNDMRAVSHGCMRTQNPIELGDYLMEGNDKYEEAKKTSTPKYFKPTKPLQVVITYYTTWVDDAGKVQYKDDVYGKDGEVWEKLKLIIHA